MGDKNNASLFLKLQKPGINYLIVKSDSLLMLVHKSFMK